MKGGCRRHTFLKRSISPFDICNSDKNEKAAANNGMFVKKWVYKDLTSKGKLLNGEYDYKYK